MRSIGISDDTQRVLVVPNEIVGRLYAEPRFHTSSGVIDSVIAGIDRYGRFVRRDWAETHDYLKQVIAYGVVHYQGRLLCVRRTQKTDRGSLRLRYTVLFGGHVDDYDAGQAAPILNCLLREVDEELGIVPSGIPRIIGVVTDPSTDVGRLHLGVIYAIEVKDDKVVLDPLHDTGEFVRSRQRREYELMAWSDINRHVSDLDPWSTLVVRSHVGESLLRSTGPTVIQSLPLTWDNTLDSGHTKKY